MTIGEDQSAGGVSHATIMVDAYAPLTRAGLDVSITRASGTDPDGLARPAPAGQQRVPTLVSRLVGDGTARLEASHTTGTSKPASDVKHILDAAAEGAPTSPARTSGTPTSPRRTSGTPTSPARNSGPPTSPRRSSRTPTSLARTFGALTSPGQSSWTPASETPS